MQLPELLELIRTHDESEILDYKENLNLGSEIGEYISALGNAALLTHNPAAYLIWGVKDVTKDIVGTSFNPDLAKASEKNPMPLVTYLEKFTDPRIPLDWDKFTYEGNNLLVLTINVTHVNKPIKFKGEEYIRSGSSKSKLSEFPEKEREIWQSFESSKFELEVAKNDVPYEEVVQLLDTAFYIRTRDIQDPDDTTVIKLLVADNVLIPTGPNFNITNLGAYTLAKRISDFPSLSRKTLRITRYAGNQSLSNAIYDKKGQIGIAVGFNNIIKNIMNSLPRVEDYSEGIRQDVPIFPQIAIRELVANALVHQDFTISGSRPFVEIYDNRIEISNPGTPLIEPKRFLDFKPKSRNDELADLLGNLNIVESRGTGIDKVVNALEDNDLPAMDIKTQASETTVVTLNIKKAFKDMSNPEKIFSIYWHASLKYQAGEQITNASLRDRFRLNKNSSPQVSAAINNAVSANLIKLYDPTAGKKFVSYIPYWGTDAFGNY